MINLKISPLFKGEITPYNIISSEGTIILVVDNSALTGSCELFSLQYNGFVFKCGWERGIITLTRNNDRSILSVPERIHAGKAAVFITWNVSSLGLRFFDIQTDETLQDQVKTLATETPLDLHVWAHKNNLLEILEYDTIEAFREKILSCLQSCQYKLLEAGSQSQFWNVIYDGKRIVERRPKKEIEVQPIFHTLLSDQALLGGFLICPEYPTGVGDLDFLFSAKIKGRGIENIFVEVKNAHSVDLLHGLNDQLPKYMRNKKCKYGIYCVLNYKGEWFQAPDIPEGVGLDVYLSTSKKIEEPLMNNISITIIDLAKPITASKV